jgi:aryl-alcohol dehydrogenase-like predicted oxidoreductase
MQRRFLGTTGLSVSRLGLGTWTWARETDEHEAREQLVAFVEAGGSLVDTSAGYSAGESERLLGRLLDEVVDRDDVVLATKAGFGPRGGDLVVDASRGHLLRSLDASLRRLGVDHVDLWQVHSWDEHVPLEETLSALDHAVTSGRATYVGISNYSGWQSARAVTWQQAVPGRATPASTQVEYSLLNRAVEGEVIPAARALGLGVLAYSPLAMGVLTGKYRTGTPADSRAADPRLEPRVGAYRSEQHTRVVEAVARAAEGLEWSMPEVALAWLRDRPGVTAPVLGARTAAQLRSLLTVEECELPPEILRALDDVSEGMRGR